MSHIIPNHGGACQVDWCGEAGGHAGNHRRVLGEVAVPEYNKASAVVVSVEGGPAEVKPLPVLTFITALGVPIAATRLDWVGSARLGGLLSEAVTRFE